MNCRWIDTHGPSASDTEWEEHLSACDDCLATMDGEERTESSDHNPIVNFFRQPVAVPASLLASVMGKVAADSTNRGFAEHALHLDSTAEMRMSSLSRMRKQRNWGMLTAAAVVVLGLTMRMPLAQAMNHVIAEIHTVFFPHSSTPVKVKVSDLTPAQKQAATEEFMSNQQKSLATVFANHKQEILDTYKTLPLGTSRGLKFSDGTGFDVVKQDVLTTMTGVQKASISSVPVLSNLPDGLEFDKGTVRISGNGDSTAEVNLLFTPHRITQSTGFEYQKYTDQDFSLGKGTYLSVNMTVADGVLETDYIGDFQLKKAVKVQNHPGVLMQYSNTWKPQPGIVLLSFGVSLDGHRYTVLLGARGISPDTLLGIAEKIVWQR